MKLLITIALSVIFINNAGAQGSAGTSLNSLLKRNIACKLKGGLKDRFPVNNVRNAAYAYSYWLPSTFKEIIAPGNKYTDTETYITTDKKCLVKIWPGRTISFPLGEVNSEGKFLGVKPADIMRVEKTVDGYVRLIKAGNEDKTKHLKITEFCRGLRGYNYQMALRGVSGSYGYIYKIDVSELPVSGDLIFKHFLYRYDINSANQYRETGITMANSFAEF